MTKASRLRHPDGRLSLKKVAGWASSLMAILGFLGAIGTGLWKVFDLTADVRSAKEKATNCEQLLTKHDQRHQKALTQVISAIREVDRDSRERDYANSTATVAVQTQVNTLHGGNFRPVLTTVSGGMPPRTRSEQVEAAREQATEAIRQAQSVSKTRPVQGDDHLSELDQL